jgi:tRNA-2-methylthio-N6-dimethylallyladenosine synthase
VLVERAAKKGHGELAGRTENNRWVNFPGPASLLHGFTDVLVTEARPHSLRGRRVGAAMTENSPPPRLAGPEAA